MKPLLMMRTKGITGSFFAKHAHCMMLSKSSGNAYGLGIKGKIEWQDLPAQSLPFGSDCSINLLDYVTPTTDVTFTLASGTLPTGITLNADGTFSGTATVGLETGSATFTATNADGPVDSGVCSWDVGDAPP